MPWASYVCLLERNPEKQDLQCQLSNQIWIKTSNNHRNLNPAPIIRPTSMLILDHHNFAWSYMLVNNMLQATKKNKPQIFIHIFAISWPILEIFPLAHSVNNLQERDY